MYRDYKGLGFPISNLSPKGQLELYFSTVCHYSLGMHVADPKDLSSD